MTNNIATSGDNGVSPSGAQAPESNGHNLPAPTTTTSTPAKQSNEFPYDAQEKPPYCSTTVVDLSSSSSLPPPYQTSSVEKSPSKAISLVEALHLLAVVVASSTINGVVFGVVNNFGVFYAHLTTLFKTDSSLLDWGPTFRENQIGQSNSTASDSSPLVQSMIGKSQSVLTFCCALSLSLVPPIDEICPW